MTREISVRLSVEGQQQVRAALQSVGAAGEDALKAFERGATIGAQSFAKLERALDPVVAGQERFAAAQARINRAVETGETTQQRATQLLDLARRKHLETEGASASLAKQTGSTSLAMRNLGIQSVDFFQQLASGAPVMLTAIQQGGQLAQVAATSGTSLGQMARGAAGAILSINPFALAAAAATVAVTGFATASEMAARDQLAVQNSLRATRSDYVAMAAAADAAARAVAKTSGVGTSEARAAATQFAAQPNFAGGKAEIEALLRTADDLSARLGISFAEAAAKMAPAMRDASTLAKDLENRLTGFNAEMTRSIELQVRGGDAAGAYDRVLRRVADATRGAAEQSKTGLQKALQDLANEFTLSGSGATSFGDIMLSWGEKYVRYLQFLVTTTKDVATKIGNLVPGGGAANGQAGGVSPTANFGAGTTPANRILANRGIQLFDSVAKDIPLSPDQLAFARNTLMAESGGNASAVSRRGAIGLMGLMPDTAAGLGVDPNDSVQNVTGGIKYIGQLWAKYGGDPMLVAMAYNWGPGNVDRFLAGSQAIDGIPTETRGHVLKVTGLDTADRFAPMPLPPEFVPPPTGVRNDPSSVIAATVARATSAGGVTVAREGAQADINAYREALRLLAEQGETTGSQVDRLREALAAASKTMVDAIPAADKLLRDIQDQTGAAERMAQAYAQGDAAVADVIARTRAEAEARQTVARGTAEYAALVEVLTAKYKGLGAAQGGVDIARQVSEIDKATEAQLRINAAYDGTQESITRAQNAEKAHAELVKANILPGMEQYEGAVQKLADAYDRSGAASRDSQHAQQSVTAIMDTAGNAADRMGQALVDATFSGEQGFVSLANVAKASIFSLIADVAKLGGINPLINAVVGSNIRPTLSTGLSVLSGGGAASADGGSGGGGGLFSGISNAFTLGRAGDALGLTNIGGQLSRFGNWTGLTGEGGILSGVGSGINSILSTPLWGAQAGIEAASAAQVAAATAPSGLLSEAAVAGQMGLPSSLGSAGFTVGQLASGVGLGFGAGSLAGGLVQNAFGKTGPAPQIGAGIGAIGGTLIGSIFGGPVLGGLIGGLLGGSGGGLIGPKPASPFSATGLTTDSSGLLAVGRTVSQIVDTTAEVAALGEQVARVNAILSATGARIANGASVDEFGQNRLIGGTSGEWLNFGQGNGRPGDLSAAFGQLRFTTNNADANAVVSDRSFASLDDLAAALKRVGDAGTFLENVVPALTDLTERSATFSDALDALNTQYGEAITFARDTLAAGDLSASMAERLRQAETDLGAAREQASLKAIDAVMAGLAAPLGSMPTQLEAVAKSFDAAIADVRKAVGSSAAVADRLRQAEDQLTAARDRQTQRILDAARDDMTNYDAALNIRYLAATADPLTARLAAADESARLQKAELDRTLVDMWGESIRSAQSYADQMALLDRALVAEREAIQTEANRVAAAQAQAASEKNAAWVNDVYNVLTQDNTAAGAFARQLQALNDNFDQAAAKARELGLAEDGLNIARARQMQAAADRRDLDGLKLIAAQQGTLTEFLDAMRVSGASPADRLGLAQQGFASALEAARGEDLRNADLSAVTRAAGALIDAGRSFYATGPGAADLERFVRGSIEALGAQLDLPAFGGDLERSLAKAVNPLKDELEMLRDEVTALREELRTARLLRAA